MPNWCMNKLTVSGPAQELKRFVEASIGFPACYSPQEWKKKADPIPDTPYFCFNALIPTPPEVLATGYSARQNQPENAFWRAMAGESVPGMDGDHWNLANWGVKWDIYVDKIDRETLGWTEGCDRIEVVFDTALSMPERWFATASELFPQLSFKLHSEEPGCYFAGDMLGENGVVSTEYYNDEKLREIFAWTEA